MSSEQFNTKEIEEELKSMLFFSLDTEESNPLQVTSKVEQIAKQVFGGNGKKQKKSGKKKQSRRNVFITLLSVLLLFCIYLFFSYQYQNKFFRGTMINGIDCSGMKVTQAKNCLKRMMKEYSLTITFRNGKTEKIQGDDIGYVSVFSDKSVQEIKNHQMPLLWISGYFRKSINKVDVIISYDATILEKTVLSLDEVQEAQMTVPKDAYVAWQENSFVVLPEVPGNWMDKEKLLQEVRKAVAMQETHLNVENLGIYKEPAIKKDSDKLVQQAEELNQMFSGSITYMLPSTKQVLDGGVLISWLVQDEEGRYHKNEEVWNQHIRQYVVDMATVVDTLYKNITFHATGIAPVKVPNKVFGWKIDQEAEINQLKSELHNGVVTVREPLYESRSIANENNGIGHTYVEIDLSRQHMWIYENSQLWMETDIVSGKMSHDRYTSPGVFQLYHKDRERWLRGPKKENGSYEWNVFVHYWMAFNDSVGIHDASWQDDFGGRYYIYGGSRGCINMPSDQAAKLYDWITVGIPIITYYSEDIIFID